MILLDLNVVLDVLQKRDPHYRASAAVLETVIRGQEGAALPAHAFTTIHYIVGRYRTTGEANDAVDWLLRHLAVAEVGRDELLRARQIGFRDFEDAVVAAAAEAAGCTAIVTRNVRDFRDSPVSALTPEEYLLSQDGN